MTYKIKGSGSSNQLTKYSSPPFWVLVTSWRSGWREWGQGQLPQQRSQEYGKCLFQPIFLRNPG